MSRRIGGMRPLGSTLTPTMSTLGLSNEARQKLQSNRPRTLGHARRIDGMTPAALMLLAAHVPPGAGGSGRGPR